MLDERMKVGPARMHVRVENWPDGRPGLWVEIGDSKFLFTVEGALRLKDAIEYYAELAEREPRVAAEG